MPHRDDRDALLHRADALEREAARLRRENRALRRDADARRELEALAADAEPPRPPPPPPRPASSGRATRVEHALGGELGPVGLIGIAALATAIGALPFLVIDVAGASVTGPVLAVLVGVVALLVNDRRVRRRAARERAHLEAWWPTLDVHGYLAYLAREHAGEEVVHVTVRPRRPVDEATRDLIARVARAAGAGATWWGGDLILTSAPLPTASWTEGIRTYDNRPIHAWFRRLERRVLRPVARHVPLASIRVGSSA